MPELPEVETTRRGIAPHLEGQAISRVVVRDKRLRLPVPDSLGEELPGRRIQSVERRGKYLLLHAEGKVLLVHLGMSGSLRISTPDEALRKHDHVDLEFGDRILRYHDPRRFGVVDWWPGRGEDHPLIAPLGIEPLSADFDGAWLHRATRGRKAAVKLVLMDAHTVVGVGNIYASESLFRAGIRPTTPAGSLSATRCEKLAQAVQATLAEAIAAGGSTLRDYVNGEGNPGYFQLAAYVYGREGEPCRVCGTPIRHRVLGQRATYWCPHCQH